MLRYSRLALLVTCLLALVIGLSFSVQPAQASLGGSRAPSTGVPSFPAAGCVPSSFTNKVLGNGLGSMSVNGVYAVGSNVYAATGDPFFLGGGVSISTDGGRTFTNKTTANGLGSDVVKSVYADGNKVYAATGNWMTGEGGLSISSDGGNTFVNKTTADGLGSSLVSDVYAAGSMVYAVTDGGLSVSTDGGNTFTSRTTADGLGSDYVNGVYAIGSTVYAATSGGLSISTDGGSTFTNRTTADGLGSNGVGAVYAVGSTVYAGTGGGLSISTDGAITFTNKTTADGLGRNGIGAVFAEGSAVYAVYGWGLSISMDGGNHFVNKTTADGLGSGDVSGVYAVGTTVYAAITRFPSMTSLPDFGGLAVSTDGGNTFTDLTEYVFSSTGVYAVGDSVYGATYMGLFISTDGGATFSDHLAGLGSYEVNGVYTDGSVVYAATSSVLPYPYMEGSGGLSVSADGGNHFATRTTADGLGSDKVLGVYADGSTVYAATREFAGTGGGLSISTDGGNHFVNKTTADGLGSNNVNGVYAVGGDVYAATDGGLSISTDGGNHFVNKTKANGLGSNSVNDVYAVGSTVYAATDIGLAISTDGGNHFVNKTKANGLGSKYVNGIYAIGSTVYAATVAGLSLSTDGGANFVNKTKADGLGYSEVSDVYAVGSTVYAASGGISVGVCAPAPISVENQDSHLQYDGWRGVANSHASGGSYRASNTPGDTVTFTFTGTSVQWMAVKGPDMGIAQVSLDGLARKEQDLYKPGLAFETVGIVAGLTSGKHTLVIRVSGRKNASASDSNVAVDAFVVGTKRTEENGNAVQYGRWRGAANTGASGGSYRVSGDAGSVVTFRFEGDSVDWITAKGPAYGRAEVVIDGVSKGTHDLYQAKVQWRVAIPFTGLGSGAHTLKIHVLGTKNSASKGRDVVVDAFRGVITPN